MQAIGPIWYVLYHMWVSICSQHSHPHPLPPQPNKHVYYALSKTRLLACQAVRAAHFIQVQVLYTNKDRSKLWLCIYDHKYAF